MTLDDRRCDAFDVIALGDVTDLVLGLQVVREGEEAVLPSSEEYDQGAASGESPRDRFADPARSAGDDSYRQTRTCRVAARVRPLASRATARSRCFPVEAAPRFHEPL